MRIKRLQLTSYGSFADSGSIEFGPGINILVGENNSGKSLILRSLAANFADERHKSSSEYRRERLLPSRQGIDLEFSGEEFETAWLRMNVDLMWPIPKQNGAPDIAAQMVRDYVAADTHVAKLSRAGGGAFVATQLPSHGQGGNANLRAYQIRISADGIRPGESIGNDNFASIISQMWSDSLFVFDAQRLSLGKFQLRFEPRLSSNAANLAAVLSRLQGEQGTLFQQLVAHMREMFSTVRNISVVPGADGQFDIRVWPEDQMMNIDLSFSLDSSGTGLSQALAILTVAMTMERSVIVVDEISSFLHPSAAKALLRIIQTHYPNHQYLISTHSPEVLSSVTASTVYLIRKRGYESTTESIDLQDLAQLRNIAAQLGVSMTDVFAADRVVWVEGLTEELCFPLLLETGTSGAPRGTVFAPIVATGDFSREGKRTELILEIYERLSSAALPLLESVAFSFDSEKLSESEKADILRMGKGRVHLLPRRNFECYLVDADAIAQFITGYVSNARFDDIQPAVTAALARFGHEQRYGGPKNWSGDLRDEGWLRAVDGAKLIRDVCRDVSRQQLEFAKGAHSLELLQYIIANKRSLVEELMRYVEGLVAQ